MASSGELLTTRQYAERAGVTSGTVTKWIRSGKLKAEKIGKKWMLSADQLGQAESSSHKAPSTPKSAPAPSGSAPIKTGSGRGDGKFYSVEEFSAMTYLTEFGVTEWLKQGRLEGKKDDSGRWRVAAGNLQRADIQRLVRK